MQNNNIFSFHKALFFLLLFPITYFFIASLSSMMYVLIVESFDSFLFLCLLLIIPFTASISHLKGVYLGRIRAVATSLVISVLIFILTKRAIFGQNTSERPDWQIVVISLVSFFILITSFGALMEWYLARSKFKRKLFAKPEVVINLKKTSLETQLITGIIFIFFTSSVWVWAGIFIGKELNPPNSIRTTSQPIPTPIPINTPKKCTSLIVESAEITVNVGEKNPFMFTIKNTCNGPIIISSVYIYFEETTGSTFVETLPVSPFTLNPQEATTRTGSFILTQKHKISSYKPNILFNYEFTIVAE